MIKKTIGTLCAAVFALGLSAQTNQLSFGVDLGLPLGDFGDAASLLVGPSVGFELPVGDNIGITAQVGYSIVSVSSDLSDFVDSQSMIPAQVGIKYYLSENQAGAYAHGQVGIHSSTIKTPDVSFGGIVLVEGSTTSSSNMSFAIGGGYMLEKFDFGLRYNVITTDVENADASSYIGVRIAYILGLGG